MVLFLTGATGLVGGELLVNLAKRKEVTRIFCLLRAKSPEAARERLRKVFELHGDHYDESLVQPVLGDLFEEDLAAKLAANPELAAVDTIIHSAANTSFSRFNDALVEKANIGGLTSILLWAKALPLLETFLYIGTATICGKDIQSRVIHEDESPNLDSRHVVRYTYTKMRGELLIREHLRPEQILIARPSIIMGDSRPIMPRSAVILWAMATINYLRLVPVNALAPLDIIPVDYAAEAIIRLLFTAQRRHSVYHISAGPGSTTAQQLAEALAAHFTDMPPFRFLHHSMIDDLKHWAKNRLHAGSELHSHRDYLDYWKETFQDKSRLRILFSGLQPYLEFMELGHVFDNTRLLTDTGMPPSEPAHEYIRRSMEFVEKIDVLEGEIDP